MSVLIPVDNRPILYVTNLQVSNNATTPNTKLDVAAGSARNVSTNSSDTNTNDIVLTSGVTIDAGTVGINGIDTGSLEASKDMYVYVLGSSANLKTPGCIVSLSATVPVLPEGYDIWKLIAYCKTDGSSHFLRFYTAGNGNYRQHYWKSSIKVLNDGTANTLTAISLATALPPINDTPVLITAEFTPATANDNVAFAPYGSDATVLPFLSGSVAAKMNSGQFKILSKLDSTTPKILYINSAASGNTDVYVNGFEYFI